MGIVLMIIGIILVLMSILLMLIYPVAGIIGIICGIGAFVYGRKYKKQNKQNDDYVNIENECSEEFKVAGFDHYQDELSSLLVTRNDDYRLSNKSFIEDIAERTYEYYPEWYDAELVAEPDNEFDANAIAVKVQDMKIGYIARKDQARYKALNADKAEAEIYGGNYKDIDFGEYGDECSVTKGNTPYKATLYIKK